MPVWSWPCETKQFDELATPHEYSPQPRIAPYHIVVGNAALCITAKLIVEWQQRVKTRIYRAAALLSASPQLTDLDPSVADWFREEGLSEAKWPPADSIGGLLQIAPSSSAVGTCASDQSMLMQQPNGAFLTSLSRRLHESPYELSPSSPRD
jgi:hypothetical protein